MAQIAQKYLTAAEEHYAKLKGRKLVYHAGTEQEKIGPIAPKHITGLKEAMALAAKAGTKMNDAIKVYLKEHGLKLAPIEQKPVEPESPAAEAEQTAGEEATAEEEQQEAEPAGDAAEPPADVELKLDPVKWTDDSATQLKGTIAQLQKAGVKVSYRKTMTPDEMRQSIIDALDSIRDISALVGTYDSEKLMALTGRKDPCFELMVDPRDEECSTCPHMSICTKGFLGHVANDFAKFRGALSVITTEEQAHQIRVEHVAAVNKAAPPPPKGKAKAPIQSVAIGYDPNRAIQVNSKLVQANEKLGMEWAKEQINGLDADDQRIFAKILNPAYMTKIELGNPPKPYRGHTYATIRKIIEEVYGELENPEEATVQQVQQIIDLGLKMLRLV